MIRCLVILFAAVFAGRALAADPAADFSAANEMYAKGNYAAAAAAYEKIMQSSGESPSLLFNDGNAEFKAGHLGKAIAAYRRAALLTPRDAELRANLEFVRNQVQGPTLRESHWQSWVGSLSLNEGSLLTAVFFWIMLGLLTLRQLRPSFIPRLRTPTRIAVLFTVCSAAILTVQAANHFGSSVAVVTEAEAPARSGPFDDAQTVFKARDGEELQVTERHDTWVQVANATGKIGWLRLNQVEVLPGT